METREYFEKVMQDFRSTLSLGSSKNQHRNGRSFRRYCQTEGIDYKWLMKYKKSYGPSLAGDLSEGQSLVPLAVEEERKPESAVWQVSGLRLESPDGGFIEISSNSLSAVSSLLQSLSMPC